MKQYVYRWRAGDKEHGSIRVLKPGVDFEEYLKKLIAKDQTAIKISKPPAIEECDDSIVEAVDGCSVEPDGICQHGFPSVLLAYGVI